MIIICVNCNKKFEINSDLIPDQGRLLQCSGCNHKWFFKKEILKQSSLSNESSKTVKEVNLTVEKSTAPKVENTENIELLDNKLNKDLALEKISTNTIKDHDSNNHLKILNNNEKNYNILGITIVFLISFAAIIVVLDTFKSPISIIVPNIEFLLYSLYETINDIELFLKNLV